jgi:hypothetical protein
MRGVVRTLRESERAAEKVEVKSATASRLDQRSVQQPRQFLAEPG